MAEGALKKLEEQLNCSICLDIYTNPKLLQCFHVFCQRCLVPLGVRDQQGQLSLTCPSCRQPTPIPDSGVAGLQPAFHITNLLEIQDSIQKVQNPSAILEKKVTDPKSMKKPITGCLLHGNKEFELYCETCEELICYKCVIKDGKHHSHNYDELKQAFERYKEEIAPSLQKMETQVDIVRKALSQLSTRCREISNQRAAIEDNLHLTFSGIREVLAEQETELVARLNQMTQGKLKGLATQKDQIETTLVRLTSCLHFIGENFQTENMELAMMTKTNTGQQVNELTTPFLHNSLKPNTEADMVFSELLDLADMCRNYGKVFASSSSPDPFSCSFIGKGVESVPLGEKITTTIEVINFEGEPYEEAIDTLETMLESEIGGTSINCHTQRRGKSQYEISCQPTVKGRHQLHIKMVGQHIRGSPLTVSVQSPVEKLGTPILTINELMRPQGVSVSMQGDVFVSEMDKHCISVFSPSGEKKLSFGTRGSGHGQFQYPRGIVVYGKGDILVADWMNHRVQKFTGRGQFLAAVGEEGCGPLQFSSPSDIAFNTSNNKVYVVDGGNHRVQVLNSDLTFSNSFGMEGSGIGQLSSPRGVACDSRGRVYVADGNNNRIQVFTAEGKFLRMFGRHGQRKGELDRPISVAVDTNDMVYVSEGSNHRISVFVSVGQFAASFGGRGERPGEFCSPCGLAIDSSGVVYVCDYLNNRIQML